MKTKKSIWSIALSLIIAFAMVFGITLVNQPKSVKADVTYDGHITFDVKVDTENSISVPAGYGSAITVTYTVTETTGVDALQLRLGYDHTAFTLNSVSTIDDDQESTSFALGHATHGAEGYLENIVFDNVNTNGTAYVLDEEDEDDLIITAVFYLNQPTPATAYTFSLYNVNDEEEDELGSYSTAWKINPNAQDPNDPAIHNPVEIQFANEAIVYVRGTYTDFTLTGGSKTYDGVAVPNSAITITHGENTPVEMRPAISAENVVWFTYNEALWQEQNVSRYIKLDSNPVAAGTYYAVVEFNGNNFYGSYKGYTADELYGDYGLDIGEGKVAEYVISPRGVNVTIDSKESAYGESLLPLTFTVDPQTPVIGNDSLGISLFSDANSLVPGTSPITGSAGNANYTVSFTNGTYTVTARNVTIIIADKTSAYGAAIVELTYTIDANTTVVGEDDLGISLSTTATSSSNVGTYPITGSASNTKYNVTFRNTAGTDTKGTYTITSQNINALNYFTGKTVTFDANSHDLLNVSNEKPNWVSYTAENNNQTNANTYTITITATIGTQDALNYLSSDLLAQLEQTENGYKYVTTVEGKINSKTVTVTADNKSHVYGNTPATLTPVTVGVNNEVTVIFTVKDANEETITLSTTTPVGTYTIVPSATNSNYAFTFNNGTYTVSKETATISISAEGIIYSRELNYTVSNAKVGTLDAPYTVEIRNSNNQVVTGVLPVGDYTIIAKVADTDNYNGATAQATFTVTPNVVGKPIVDLEQEIEQIHFDNDTVTWDAVTKDIFGNDLYNTTVTYRIGGVEYNNRSFTATSAGSYVIEILSSNENYLSNQVTLTVYSVTFTEGSHPASSNAEVEGLPATQYRFEGETATQPEGTPTVAGYTFNGWDFDFETEIEENTEIPALWTITQRTMTVVYVHSANNTYVETSKTFNVNYNSNVVINTSNFIEKAHITDIISQYSLNGMRYTFNGFWNYKVTGEDEYIRENVTDIVVNATQNYTFVARYTATPINYEITYYFSIDGAPYTQSIIENDQYTSAAYGSTINYVTPNSQKWFRVEAWYLDEARTQVAPVTMPAHDLTVYGALVFNVGKGDVNGDGYVDANDITLYRRWIVGGYEITALLNNNDLYEASEMETEDPSDTVYFIARVADTNAATFDAETLGDGSKDIRDVSTIRMGLVGGYGFSIVEDVDVTGEDLIIIREFAVESANDLLALARSGAKVTLSEDITDATLDAEILDSNKDIIIDLNGHTLTLKSFRVTLAQGNTGKILVTNGRINVSDGNGVYLTAVDGSVHLDNVTLYDDNGLFVIQTANHSLHLFNVVRFLKREIVNNEPVEASAEVLVVKDSHIVVEENATVTIDKVVVAEIVEVNNEEQVVPVDENSDAEITIANNSAAVEEIVVEGNKVSYEIATISDLVGAMNNGGSYKLVANLSYTGSASFNKDTTINLNGYKLQSVNDSALSVVNGATLTINGNGNVEAQEVCVLVLDGSKAVINGGEYTSHDNFVVGTNGSTGRGNNLITINAGAFNGNITTAGYVACGIYVANNDTVNVNGGTFNITNGVGILARSGNTTVAEDVVFNVTGNGTLGKVGDSQVTVPSGEVLVIDFAANYPGGTPVLINNSEYEVYAIAGGISNQAQLLEAAANGGSYKVLADFTVNQQVNIEKDFILDGDNHTITFNKQDSNYYAFYVVSENVLSASFSNLNIVSTGYQVAIMTNLDAEGSLVNVNNVDITCDGECIYANGFGVVNATNCEFTRNGKYAQGKDDVYYSALTVGYAGTINATNCTVTSDRNGVSTFPSGGTINLTNVDVTVTANDASAIWSRNEDYNNLPAYNKDSVITINSGNIVGGLKLTDKYTTGNKNYHEPRIVITGGTFDHDPTAYLADGYYYIEEDNIYTVYEGIHTYAQLVEAAANGGDYTLTADIDLEETIAVTADMTLRLNGHRIYNTQDLWVGNNWSLISVRNGANLTIKGDNGILDAKANDCYALDVCDNGTITLDGNGTYIGNISAVYAYEGIVTINGGSFDLKQLSDGTGEEPYRYELNCYDSNYRNGSANFVVKGGSFTHFNPQGSTGENPTANYVAEGYYAVEENGVYTIKAGTTGSGQDPIVGPGPNPSFPF